MINFNEVFKIVSDRINEVEIEMENHGFILPAHSENLSWIMHGHRMRIVYGLKPLIEHKATVRMEFSDEIELLKIEAEKEMKNKYGKFSHSTGN